MNSAQMKEQIITEYIKNIDFISQNFSVEEIKADLRETVGEVPAIQIDYNKDRMVVEDKNTGEKSEVVETNVKSITIAFSDGEQEINTGNGQTTTVPKMHKFTLYI